MSDSIANLVSSDGYCCFSKGHNRNLCKSLMWSHYADGLRGFCLAFDEDILLDSLSLLNEESIIVLNPVEYSNSVPVFNIYDHIDNYLKGETEHHFADEFYFQVRSMKANSWKYELEYRAISSKAGIHPYSPDAVFEVFIGENMNPKNRLTLQSILSTRYPKAIISEVRMERDSYKLGVHRK